MVKLSELTKEELEEVEIPGTNLKILNYIHGRCQIFAKALHEELGYEMELLWDDDYWFIDSWETGNVLVHAYCVVGDKCVDARGFFQKEIIDEDFECNTHRYEDTKLEELEELIREGVLDEPQKGEMEALRKFIKDNRENYCSSSL